MCCKHVVHSTGGTNVSLALECPNNEERVIVSMDTSEMDRILWLDEENLTVHVQSGMIGQDLERVVRGVGIWDCPVCLCILLH